MSLNPERVTLEEFALLLRHFYFRREIGSVHLHYTRYPNHRQYQGAESIAQLWRRQTQVHGLQNVAQHLTIGPDGSLWLGRNWNLPPVSAAGHNGNAQYGPFMIMLVGNFDPGGDRWEGSQHQATLSAVNSVQQRFNLAPESLKLGQSLRRGRDAIQATSLDAEALHKELRAMLRKETKGEARGAASSSSGADSGVNHGEIGRILTNFGADSDARSDSIDAQLPEEDIVSYAAVEHDGNFLTTGQLSGSGLAQSGRGLFGSSLSEEVINELRPHVINLEQGQFSPDGEIYSTQEDVDAIFEEHLVRALADAQARGQKLHLLFYAHGGLVDETGALTQAARHIPWWKENHVYPIYFVWETGLFEIIGQWIRSERRQRQRHGERPGFTDDLIELTARHLGGALVWGGMKRSAERASAPGGGAHYTAGKLKEFCDAHPNDIVLHAIGHSAGAIFHSHFLPAALDLGVPSFRTVNFLAPALRIDRFHERLANRMGNGIEKFAIFTLRRTLELIDPTIPVYEKSILYLIYYALEQSPRTPLLGLEGDLRRDVTLKALFGIGEQPSAHGGEVIWAQTELDNGRSATKAKTHIDFPRDKATMNSLLRRMLDKSDSEQIIGFETTVAERIGISWDLDDFQPAPVVNTDVVVNVTQTGDNIATPANNDTVLLTNALNSVNATTNGGGLGVTTRKGYRRALCVGIDTYASAPLSGCVADARLWQELFIKMGFETPAFLTNEQATHAAIQDELRRLLQESMPGDVVVFQFAGHGTQLPDLDGDEALAGLGQFDQAICPYDYDQGAFLLDDDLGTIFGQAPDHLNITCFIDCCYSGTITRLAVGRVADQRARGANMRARSLVPTIEMIEAHKRFRQNLSHSRSQQRGRSADRGPDNMREVVFSACQPYEVAWETDGQGDFTRRAVQLLQTTGGRLTHEQFCQQVVAAFGPSPRQQPLLDCAPATLRHLLLEPLAVQIGVGSGNPTRVVAK